MQLKYLIQKAKESRGSMVLFHMNAIRRYFMSQDINTLLEEINLIDDAKDLDMLIGVGMRGIFWKAVVKRQAYLEGV